MHTHTHTHRVKQQQTHHWVNGTKKSNCGKKNNWNKNIIKTWCTRVVYVASSRTIAKPHTQTQKILLLFLIAEVCKVKKNRTHTDTETLLFVFNLKIELLYTRVGFVSTLLLVIWSCEIWELYAIKTFSLLFLLLFQFFIY